MVALHDAPAVVDALAATAGCRGPIHLLVRVLAHVGDPEVVCLSVEAECVWVAKPVRPDLAALAGLAHEWVAARDRVGQASGGVVDIEPQHLPKQCVEVLAVVVGIAAAAAIARAYVQVPVRPEFDPASVVVAEGRVGDRQDDLLGRGIGLVRVGRDVELRDAHVAGRSRVADEEAAVRGVLGMEGES